MKVQSGIRLGQVMIVVLLLVGISGVLVLADSDCWCAQFVDLREDIPTRRGSVLLSTVASAALIGVTFYATDYLGLPNADWVKMGALVTGVGNISSSLSNLLLPTERAVERAEDRIADSVLDEELCADTLTGYAGRVSLHRYLNSAIDIVSGLAQVLLLSPTGTYATGELWDYVYLVAGGIDLIGGVIKALFSTPFERDVRDARRACGI